MALTVLSVGLAASLIAAPAAQIENWWTVLVLATVAAFAERGTVLLGKDTEQSISLVPTLFAAVLFGPLASMLVAAASMIGEFTRREAWAFDRPLLRLGVYTNSRVITGAVAGLVAAAAGQLGSGEMSTVVVGTTAAALVASRWMH